MTEPQLFELTLEASAEVIRGCCGGDHEFGECPLDQADAATETKEEDRCQSDSQQ